MRVKPAALGSVEPADMEAQSGPSHDKGRCRRRARDFRRPKQTSATSAADRVHRKAENGSSDQAPDRSQLEQIIAGLTEGVILVEPDQTITYANEAALEMHGVTTLDELGRTVDEYRKNFVVRRHSSDLLDHGHYPIDRVVAGEAFDDDVVEGAHKSNLDRDWTHRIRSLVITDHAGNPDCLVLIVHDVSEQTEARAPLRAGLRGQSGARHDLPPYRPALCQGERGLPRAYRLQAGGRAGPNRL